MKTAEVHNAELTGSIKISPVPPPVEAYPGQFYFHRHNANIRRAEEDWEVDKAFEFLQMPPIPDWYLEFIEGSFKAAEAISAKTNLLPAVRIERNASSS